MFRRSCHREISSTLSSCQFISWMWLAVTIFDGFRRVHCSCSFSIYKSDAFCQTTVVEWVFLKVSINLHGVFSNCGAYWDFPELSGGPRVPLRSVHISLSYSHLDLGLVCSNSRLLYLRIPYGVWFKTSVPFVWRWLLRVGCSYISASCTCMVGMTWFYVCGTWVSYLIVACFCIWHIGILPATCCVKTWSLHVLLVIISVIAQIEVICIAFTGEHKEMCLHYLWSCSIWPRRAGT